MLNDLAKHHVAVMQDAGHFCMQLFRHAASGMPCQMICCFYGACLCRLFHDYFAAGAQSSSTAKSHWCRVAFLGFRKGGSKGTSPTAFHEAARSAGVIPAVTKMLHTTATRASVGHDSCKKAAHVQVGGHGLTISKGHPGILVAARDGVEIGQQTWRGTSSIRPAQARPKSSISERRSQGHGSNE